MKELRPYQILAIDALRRDLKKSTKHLLVLPTGSGKTFTISSFLENFEAKFLFIAHTREILNQAHIQFCSKFNSENFKTLSPKAVLKNIRDLQRENFRFIIFDECHRAAAASYLKIMEYFQSPDIHFIGITATPFRTDKKSIYEIFGFPCFSVSLLDLIEEGYLCDFNGYRVKTNISLRGISTQNGDFMASRLSPVINVKNRNELILNEYKKLSHDNRTICFCCSIQHATDLNKLFSQSGIKSDVIHGSLKTEQRNSIINNFRNRKLNVLFSCQILTEGFDEPSINTIFMCRPTLSKVLYMQMIGRGSRLYPHKTHCDIFEFTDNDYDVCSLEDLVNSPIKKIKIQHGESLAKFSRRLKELEEKGLETFKEEIKIVKKIDFYQKPATEWQINELKKRGKKFKLPLTEYSANKLLWR